jgi:hypothetical protein
MALKTITGKILTSDGNPPTKGYLEIRLSQGAVITGTAEVVPTPLRVPAATDGTYSVELEDNGSLTPNGTYYNVNEYADGGVYLYMVIVPSTAGPFTMSSIQTNVAPASPDMDNDSAYARLDGATFTGDVELEGQLVDDTEASGSDGQVLTKVSGHPRWAAGGGGGGGPAATDNRVRLYLNGDQTTDGNTVKVLFSTAAAGSVDPGGNWDEANNRFIAPETGDYLVMAQVRQRSVSGMRVFYYINGSLDTARATLSADASGSFPLVDVIHLTAGEYLEVFATSVSGTFAYNGGLTFLAIRFLG